MAAPAKLNLYLHVEGRRDDGLHRLDSLIAFAEAGDVVAVAPSANLTLVADGPFAARLPPPDENLALRAAALLRERAGVDAGAAIRLTKNLPVASGIGGGSADAAAVLRALRVLWRLDPARDGGDAVAVALGADVPVCLRCRTSRVRGVGDEIVEVPDLPAAAIVLANPGVALPTAAVFRRHAAAGRQAARHPAADDGWHGIADAAAMARRLGATTNDLEAAATALAPEIGAVIAALRAAPDSLLARMSGSGATCFALFASDAAARSAARALQAAHRGWWVEATRLRTAPPPTERL